MSLHPLNTPAVIQQLTASVTPDFHPHVMQVTYITYVT